jgi:1-phosphofructokinase
VILTVTFNPAVDHTVKLDGELSLEEAKRTDDAEFDAGGNGINVAEFLTAMDVEAEATGPVGGFTGEFLKQTLTEEAVKTDFVDTDGVTRMNQTILTEDGEYKINKEGPKLGEEVVEKIVSKVKEESPEFLLISGSLPPGLEAEDIDRVAGNHSGKTVVDLHGDVMRELDEKYFFCKPNRYELEKASQMSAKTIEEAEDAAEVLARDQRFEKVFASLGEEGLVFSDGEETFHAKPPEVDVVDTVGAGDALVAGVLSVLHEGGSDEAAARKGLAAAAKVISLEGTSMPEFNKLDQRAKEIKVEHI